MQNSSLFFSSFQNFSISLYLLLVYMISDSKSDIILVLISQYARGIFPCPPSTFSPWFDFQQFEYDVLTCRLFRGRGEVFILLGVLWVPWICGLVSVINFRKFSVITSSVAFSFFSFWFSHTRLFNVLQFFPQF